MTVRGPWGRFLSTVLLSAALASTAIAKPVAQVSESGAAVASTDGSGEPWHWSLALAAAGRAGAPRTPEPTLVEEGGGRYRIDRAGIREGFAVADDCFEQTIEITARPELTGPLVLELTVGGDLLARATPGVARLDFFSPAGGPAVWSYQQVLARDQSGESLPVELAATAGGFRLTVDDADATYPVTVTAVASSASWTKAGDASGDAYGWSVSSVGDVNGDGYDDVLVGAPYAAPSGAGRAYLYYGGPGGPAATPGWTVGGASAGANFGYCVSAAGDINGDGHADFAIGALGAGTVSIYLGAAFGPSTTASLVLPGSASDQYGFAIAPAGDVDGDGYGDLLIGAPLTFGVGQAYLYRGSAGGLVGAPAVTWTGNASGDLFGYSVAAGDFDGNGLFDVAVGAPIAASTGQVTIYADGCSACGSPRSGVLTGEQFGIALAPAGDVDGDGDTELLVGANGSGSAYLYQGGPGGLAASYSWSNGGGRGTDFGLALMTAGDVNGDGMADVVVGAMSQDSAQGNVVVSEGGVGFFVAGPTWNHLGPAAGSYFGHSVSAGDTNGDGLSDLIIGAYGTSGSGSVEVYFGGGDPPHVQPAWSPVGEHVGSAFGSALALVGDVDGDGFDDAVVAAGAYVSLATCGSDQEGKIYLYRGQSQGLSGSASWSESGGAGGINCGLGASVAGAGDVDGDGYDDLVVGADAGAGQALLFSGSPSGLEAWPSWSFSGTGASDALGRSVAGAGDVNGDGYGDLLVGAPGTGSDRGRVHLFLGGNGPKATADWTMDGEAVGDLFGTWVAGAGDVNRDGYSDVIVGAPGAAAGAGKAYLFLGSASGLTVSSWSVVGVSAGDGLGGQVAGVGDVDGDGYPDVLVAALSYFGDIGIAYLFPGSASGLGASAVWSTTFVKAISAAGDTNRDGLMDIATTSYSGGTGWTSVFTGAAGWSIGLSASFTGLASTTPAVAGRGDVDGDGSVDVIVGDPTDGPNQVHLYLGNSGQNWYTGAAGVAVRPRALRTDLSAPVGPFAPVAGGIFRLGAVARSSFGRGAVRLESQVAPLGGSFGAIAPRFGPAWVDSGTSGVSLDVLAELVGANGPYLWRLRTRYQPLTSPYQSHGPWYTASNNGPGETDVRRISFCEAPSLAVTLTGSSHRTSDGLPIFFVDDANPPYARTGWNVRRSSDPSTAKSGWPLVATDVVDMDQATLGNQWTDQDGNAVSPSGVWFYQMTSWQGACSTEGPY